MPSRSSASFRRSVKAISSQPLSSPNPSLPMALWARYELQIALLDQLFPTQFHTAIDAPSDGRHVFREIVRYYDWHDGPTIYSDAIELHIFAPETLNITAESILLAILHLSAQQGTWITPDELATQGLPLLLNPQGVARQRPLGMVTTTRYQLLKTAGMDVNTASYRRLIRILRELGRVIVEHRNRITKDEGNDFLLRWRAHPADDTLLLQINWRLAAAVFGPDLRALVDLSERQQLSTDLAKVAHRWLSA
ncbi:MAG: replication protein C, IncQ-type, partial [Sulfobacillus sp.]|nr:replication protein C, IncQ-type [Sulfobacillus sp.]